MLLVMNTDIPSFFDPAVYYGNREMELFMTRLFGGFTSGFYNSYKGRWMVGEAEDLHLIPHPEPSEYIWF